MKESLEDLKRQQLLFIIAKYVFFALAELFFLAAIIHQIGGFGTLKLLLLEILLVAGLTALGVIMSRLKLVIDKKIDDLNSQQLFKPVIERKIDVTEFEATSSVDIKEYKDIDIFPIEPYCIAQSHFKGTIEGRPVEGFDFLSCKKSGFGNNIYRSIGHFAVLTIRKSLDEDVIITPKDYLKEKLKLPLENIINDEEYNIIESGNSAFDLIYDIKTKADFLDREIFTSKFFEKIVALNFDREHFINMQFKGNKVFIYVANHKGKNQQNKRMSARTEGIRAKDTKLLKTEIEKDWGQMLQIIEICELKEKIIYPH